MVSFYEGVVAKPVGLCFLLQNPNIGYRLWLLAWLLELLGEAFPVPTGAC